MIYGSMQLSHAHHVFCHQRGEVLAIKLLLGQALMTTELSAPYRDARLPDVHTPEE